MHSSTAHQLVLWSTVVGNVVVVVLLMIAAERQYPTYAISGSGIRISSVAYPNVFFPLAWSHVCIASIWLAAGSRYLSLRLLLVFGTVWSWSCLVERYAAEQFEMHAATFMIAASVIYVGLLAGGHRNLSKKRVASGVWNLRQLSIRQMFFITTWIALWIILEYQHVRRIGLTTVLKSYMGYSIPFAVLSLALVWAANPRQSKTNSVPTSSALVARILMAIGMGVGLCVLVTCLNAVVGYVRFLLSDRPVEPTWYFSHKIDLMLSRSTRIAICGFMIVPWLVVGRLSSQQAPQGHDLKRPV